MYISYVCEGTACDVAAQLLSFVLSSGFTQASGVCTLRVVGSNVVRRRSLFLRLVVATPQSVLVRTILC